MMIINIVRQRACMQQLNLYQKIPPKKAGTNLIAIILPREKQTFFFTPSWNSFVIFSFFFGGICKKIPYFGICEYIFHDNLLAIFVTNLINFLPHILHFITLKNTFYNISINSNYYFLFTFDFIKISSSARLFFF